MKPVLMKVTDKILATKTPMVHHLHRVSYGKKSCPIHKREYTCEDCGSRVGTMNEWKTYLLRRKNHKPALVFHER